LKRHNDHMRGLVLLAALFSWSLPVWAQDQAPAPAVAPAPAANFGVSLERIQKGLRVTESREQDKQAGTALRLEFQVQVYGQAPKIEVLKGVDLFNGPVPGSAPSHRQFIEHVTPQIYRTPGLPLSAGVFWLADYLVTKSKKTRCEEEIAAYRATLMQGVSVAAPRCTQ
jgi:hypothetical protein